jgi:hypothetical protein
MGDASDVATQKVKQLIVLVDKMEIQQGALEAKLKATEVITCCDCGPLEADPCLLACLRQDKLAQEKAKSSDLEAQLASTKVSSLAGH